MSSSIDATSFLSHVPAEESAASPAAPPAAPAADGTPIPAEKDCAICMEPVLPAHSIWRECCSQAFCRACMTAYLSHKVTSEGETALRCPGAGCGGGVRDDVVQALLSGDTQERLRRLRAQRAVDEDATALWCARPGCGGVARLAAAGQRSGECGDCGTRVCARCGDAAHWLPCGWAAERKFSSWAWQDDARQCPGCRITISKNGGCQHMTCRACRHEFCWHCGLNWRRHSRYQQWGLCALFRALNSRRWGRSKPARFASKLLVLPAGAALGLGLAGAALGAALAAGAVAVAVGIPLVGARLAFEGARRWAARRRAAAGGLPAGEQLALSQAERLTRGVEAALSGPAAADVLRAVADALPGRWDADSYVAYTDVCGKSTVVVVTTEAEGPVADTEYGYKTTIACDAGMNAAALRQQVEVEVLAAS